MNRKILAITVSAIVAMSFNACGSSEDDDNVFLLNKYSVEKQQVETDNGYCPLLPYIHYPYNDTYPNWDSQVAWEEEVLRVRYDSTKIATVAFSNGQTIINLSPVFVRVDLNRVQLKDGKKNDTLYINTIPGIKIDRRNESCPVSLDIAIEYIIDKNIKVIVFDGNIFQVKRQ